MVRHSSKNGAATVLSMSCPMPKLLQDGIDSQRKQKGQIWRKKKSCPNKIYVTTTSPNVCSLHCIENIIPSQSWSQRRRFKRLVLFLFFILKTIPHYMIRPQARPPWALEHTSVKARRELLNHYKKEPQGTLKCKNKDDETNKIRASLHNIAAFLSCTNCHLDIK